MMRNHHKDAPPTATTATQVASSQAARAEAVEILAAGVWALLLAGRAGQVGISDAPPAAPVSPTQSIENTEE